MAQLDMRADGELARTEAAAQRLGAGPFHDGHQVGRRENGRHLREGREEQRHGRHGVSLADPDRLAMTKAWLQDRRRS